MEYADETENLIYSEIALFIISQTKTNESNHGNPEILRKNTS